jgi:hypothetical protein
MNKILWILCISSLRTFNKVWSKYCVLWIEVKKKKQLFWIFVVLLLLFYLNSAIYIINSIGVIFVKLQTNIHYEETCSIHRICKKWPNKIINKIEFTSNHWHWTGETESFWNAEEFSLLAIAIPWSRSVKVKWNRKWKRSWSKKIINVIRIKFITKLFFSSISWMLLHRWNW